MKQYLTFNTIEYYINKLRNGEVFSFTRWGDGEWLCSGGASGANCDAHIYFPELAKGLNEALNNPKGYYLATWPETEPMMHNDNLWNYIQSRLQHTSTNWVDASIWEEAAMAGKLKNFVEQLESMNFIIVSEPSKRSLPINYTDYIEIPTTNCFLEKERIKQQMIDMCAKYDNPVFGLSASMATNVIVDELYKQIGNKCWMIDLGSIWEPFIATPAHSRSYHAKYKSKDIK